MGIIKISEKQAREMLNLQIPRDFADSWIHLWKQHDFIEYVLLHKDPVTELSNIFFIKGR